MRTEPESLESLASARMHHAHFQAATEAKRDKAIADWIHECRVYMEAAAAGLPSPEKFKRPCILVPLVIPPLTRIVKLRFEKVQATNDKGEVVYGWRCTERDFDKLKREVFQ